tara:strand:+ start:81 stop:257 length:177 start_codon:yes stop_codon:yes gene_type:complete
MTKKAKQRDMIPRWAINRRDEDPWKAIEFAAALSETFENPDLHTPELDTILAPEWSKS